MVAVAFEKWSFLKGYNCSDFSGKILVLLISDCLWEVVEHGRSIAKNELYTKGALRFAGP